MLHLRSRVIKFSFCFIIIWILAYPSSSPATDRHGISSAQKGTVVSLSDIHFNPFYDNTLVGRLIESDYRKWKAIFSSSNVRGYGGYSADTNFNLLNSALDNAQRISPRPDFIIISGDFLAHGLHSTYVSLSGSKDPAALASFIDKTIAFITLMISERFPNTPVYPALGNNDSYCGNYQIEPSGQFLARTAQTWKSLIKGTSNVDSFLRSFPVNGSYVISVPGSRGHRLIVLNTVLLSRNYVNSCGNPQSNPAQDELVWFEAQLQKASAARERVWLLYHILPGIDVFATVDGRLFDNPTLNFTGSYNQQFLDLLSRYSSTIANSFVGHTHMDSFQLIGQGMAKKATSMVTITPSISPVYGNNPGFKVFTYDRQSAGLLDYSTYYLNLGASNAKTIFRESWSKEYSFSTTYRHSSIDPLSLQATYLLMPIDFYWSLTSYSTFYNVSNTASPVINQMNWPAYWCGIGYLTAAQYTKCYQTLANELSENRTRTK